MSLSTDLRAYLLTQTGVTDLVSTRIYPNRLPDNPTLPAVVYQRITSNHNLASGNVPLVRARFQVDVWGTQFLDVDSTATALHAALDMISATGIAASVPEDDDDSYDPEALLHRRRIDFFLWRNQ